MNLINRYWRTIFRILLYGLFIISFSVTVGGLEGSGDVGRVAFVGTGMVAAASLVCITLVELYLWKKKDTNQ